jgi:hypothetical protein
MPERVTAYAIGFQTWSVVPRHIDECFADMRDCGFNTVALSFSESELRYGCRNFVMQVEMAHKRGLQVDVVPSRMGGRFAGAPLMPSLFLMAHGECVEPGYVSNLGPIACLHSLAYRNWMKKMIDLMVGRFGVDGIIWDEPKGTHHASTHPDTIATLGRPGTVEDTAESFRQFVSELNRQARSHKADLHITLFAQDGDPKHFTQVISRAEGLDYYGYDGNLAPQAKGLGQPAWSKYRVDDPGVRRRFEAEASSAGLKTFALVENMMMPASSHPIYEQNLEAYLSGPLPDHLSLYYYGHENEDPEGLHAITKRLMRRSI